MCNIAGYVGERDAAPILIDMIRRQEGMNGGYYSGIATIHEGKIYYAKLTGDVDRLIALTNAAALPGHIGIVHSRTKSGGGDEWAHPFVGMREGEVKLAYVANGSAGCFASRNEEYSRLADELCAEGFPMSARIVLDEKCYLTLSDGTSVHMSDVMCQLILKYMTEGLPTDAAMTEAFCRRPSAIVGLALDPREPDTVFFSRINCPMMVAFAPHGAYLGTSAMDFPSDAGAPTALPACASGRVRACDYSAAPYREPPIDVPQIDARLYAKAYALVSEMLGESAYTWPEISSRVRTLFEGAPCTPHALLSYEVLRALRNDRRLHEEVRRTDGVRADLSAPQTYFSLS